LGIWIHDYIDREAVHPAVANKSSHAHDRVALVRWSAGATRPRAKHRSSTETGASSRGASDGA